MVVGKGLIGKAFDDYSNIDNVLIYCSGVSNSTSVSMIEYQRELELLKENTRVHPDKTLVYFSTCSIYDPTLTQSTYVNHKRSIEEYIQKHVKQYNIFRLSNLVGTTTNKFTLINYLINAILHQIPIEIWQHAYRNLIDVDDVHSIVKYVLDHCLYTNQIINIANIKSYKILDIVNTIEKFVGKKGIYKIVDKGSDFIIPLSDILPVYQKMGIQFEENYLSDMLIKYYSK